MAFSPTSSDGQVGQSMPRNSPQVARIISPPVADTTWPHTGQVMAGATRRRRHSLPQPIVPDVPSAEKTGGEKLSQHMNLEGTTTTTKNKPSPFLTNPYNPFTRNSSQYTSVKSSVSSQSRSQSRTLNGVTMELDYEPPSLSPQQMNFSGCAGGGFEAGIPFTRPPQLTLHSPTSNDGESRGNQSLGKSHHSSIAARKSARQHQFHERRAAHLHKVQLGTKRHLAALEQDDDDDDYYTSSGPACKQYINEERMAARMNNLNISGNNSTPASSFTSMWQAAPAHNTPPPRFDWQSVRKLPTFEELESRLSDSDRSEPEDESDFRIEYAPELRKALRAKRNGRLVPDALARHVNPHCMQLVLWQPPAAILEEKVKGTIDDNSPTPPNAAGSSKTNFSKCFSDEASMECAMESPQLPSTAAPSRGNGRPSVSPLGSGWGTNVQLFDSVDDDDMDL